jgi:hypothetical protein
MGSTPQRTAPSAPREGRGATLRSLAPIAFLVLALPVGGVGCASCERAGQNTISIMGGTINDPQNKSLRRGMLAFGIDRACQEMLKRPTALREGGEMAGSATNPTNGRFFPKTCSMATAENGDVVLTFSGTGYSYASMVHKVTFDASATAQFDQDFLMSGSDLYGYFRTKDVSKPNVSLKVIESRLPAIANQLTGFGDNYAKQLLSEKLRDGFTMRRRSNSETDFRSGIVELGTWPKVDYDVKGGLVLANDRSEVHEGQRDFLGPFEIGDSDKAVFLRGRIDGAPGLNVLVMDDAAAKPWIETYLTVGDATPPPSTPRQQVVAKQGQEFALTITGKGTYWIVLDNTATIAGGYAPPGNLLDDRAAVASYAIAYGDK